MPHSPAAFRMPSTGSIGAGPAGHAIGTTVP